MLAFDSNILIYYLENDPVFAKKADQVFTQIELVGGLCSSIIITESLHGGTISFEQLGPLQSNSIQIIPVTAKIAEKAGQLRIAYGLKNIDAIHIATALLSGADTFITNDQQILKKQIPGLVIRGL